MRRAVQSHAEQPQQLDDCSSQRQDCSLVRIPHGTSPLQSSGMVHAFWKGSLSHFLCTHWQSWKSCLGSWDLVNLMLRALQLWVQSQSQDTDPGEHRAALFSLPVSCSRYGQMTGFEACLLHLLIVLKCSVPQFCYLYNKDNINGALSHTVVMRKKLNEVLQCSRLPRWLSGTESVCYCRRLRTGVQFLGWEVPWSRKWQYSCWGNPIDRGAWWLQSVGLQSWTQLSNWTYTHYSAQHNVGQIPSVSVSYYCLRIIMLHNKHPQIAQWLTQ